MSISQKNIPDFVSVLASKEPVPGGGGASALVAAIGTALGNMVGSLTAGKKKYAAVEDDIQRLKSKSDALQKDFLALIDKDAEDFAPLARAYSLPKNTPEEIAEKERVMEKALTAAVDTPLEIMKKCAEAIDVIGEFAEKGSTLAISDAGVGAIFCMAALEGASLNVFINTKSMTNRAVAEKLNKEANTLIDKYGKKAHDIFTAVKGQLH